MNGNEENINNEEMQKMEELKECLANICESMCLDALESKPNDIPSHMINYLQNKYGYSSSGLQYEEKKELEKLRNDVEKFREMDEHSYYSDLQKQVKKEVKVNEKKNKNPPKPKPRLPPDEIIVSDDEDYNDNDEIDPNLDNIEYIQNCNLYNKRAAVTENVFNIEEDQSQIKTFKKSNELIEFMKINLMKSIIFSELSWNLLKQCIDAMEEKNVTALMDVFKQGEIGDSFYFVQEGELECKMQFIKVIKEGNRKKVEKFDPKTVKIYGPGDYFGELSLLYNSPRRGTIKATTDAKLFVLKRSIFKKILRNANNEKMTRKINIFKKVPIFETLSDEEFEKLENISKEAVYNNGETILKEKEFSNVLFIIDKGKCIGTETIEEGKMPVKTQDFREGDIIGERALLRGERIPQNIIASSDLVKLICIDRFSFKNNLGSLEHMLMRNMEIYNVFFPPIQEEKPEEKPNENKEELEKNNQPLVNQNQNPVPPQNEQPQPSKIEENNIQNNQINQNNQNIQNNTINKEEIMKQVKEEVEKEYKENMMKKDEEIEQLKQQLLLLQSQSQQNNNIENNNNIQQNNDVQQIQNNNEEENNNNNSNPLGEGQEQKNEMNNIESQNPQLNEDNNINEVENQIQDSKNNQPEEQKIENEQNNKEEVSQHSSKLEILKDILTYKDKENINEEKNVEELERQDLFPMNVQNNDITDQNGDFIEKNDEELNQNKNNIDESKQNENNFDDNLVSQNEFLNN